jgi:hypothetical protein
MALIFRFYINQPPPNPMSTYYEIIIIVVSSITYRPKSATNILHA